MITARLYGGLGNQMFQYAAGYALAKRHGCPLRLETIAPKVGDNADILSRAFPIPQEIAVRNSAVLDIATRVRRRLRIPQKGVWQERQFHFDDGLEKVRVPVTLDGYFQSWRYFHQEADDIRKLFSLRDPSLYYSAMQSRIVGAHTSVSLHVRRGDYLTSHAQMVHGSLQLDYFHKAISFLAAVIGTPITIFVFSDDSDWVAQNLQTSEETVFVEGAGDRPWEDMLLMAACDHHILANSSFSWWGAWLAGELLTKQVIAPRQWFTPAAMRERNVADLCPPKWTALGV